MASHPLHNLGVVAPPPEAPRGGPPRCPRSGVTTLGRFGGGLGLTAIRVCAIGVDATYHGLGKDHEPRLLDSQRRRRRPCCFGGSSRAQCGCTGRGLVKPKWRSFRMMASRPSPDGVTEEGQSYCVRERTKTRWSPEKDDPR